MNTETSRRTHRYRQLILTVWQEESENRSSPPIWRLSLQNPHTAERTGFQAVDDLAAFLQAWMEKQGAEPEQ